MAQDGTTPDRDGAAGPTGRGAGRDPDAIWSRFEQLVRTEAQGAEGVAPPRRLPRAAPEAAPVPPKLVSAAATRAAEAPARPRAWRHRFQGAAMMAALTLAAFVAGWVHGRLASPFEPVAETPTVATTEAPTPPTATEGLAAADAAVVAAIAAADPPYRVILHVADGVAARDLARLDTAIRAWGFPAPERVSAAEAPPLPEVRFHDDIDREAARALGGIAERLFGEAVMTPPVAGGLDAALDALADPAGEAADDSTEEPADPPPSRLLELFVPAR